jgi:FkbM family methyltransferase
MKVLFMMHTINRLRNFDGVVRALADRGHTVRLAFLQKGELKLPESLQHPRIEVGASAKGRADEWRRYTRSLRRMADALRYLRPMYRRAGKLRDRAFEGIDFPFGQAIVVLYYFGWLRFLFVPLIARLLSFLERMVPSDELRINAFIREQKPDVILVSPLVQRGSEYQVDYVKGAHDLGIPVAVLPFSWDNLTNKGLMRVIPDRVLVWNQTQKDEAVGLHGVPHDRVSICGAWRFDQFFAMKPRTTKEEFCRLLTLDPARPLISYLCSSEFTSANEMDFVREWIRAIRRSPDAVLRSCGLMIRPYPDHVRAWSEADWSEFKNVAVVPGALFGQSRDASWGDQVLYDTLHHSSAVVGLNTSAMIEAAILSKPVHTILVKQFRGGQADTLHFHYFLNVNGGLLSVAKDLKRHCEQLVRSVNAPAARAEKSDRFIEAFVRPQGLDRESTPRVVEEIERLAASPKESRVAPAWETALRPRVLSALRSLNFGFGRMNLSMGWGWFAKGKLVDWVRSYWRRRYATASGGALAQRPTDKVRLDYPGKEIYICANSDQERRWQARSPSKEPWTVRWLEQHVAEGGVFYDIGSRLGVFAILAAKLRNGHSQKIIAFEPRMPSFIRLCENIRLNDCAKKVMAVPLPLASKTALNQDAGPEAPSLAFRLDELVEKHDLPKPAHIRLDCAGQELSILEGAARTLSDESLKTMLVEMSPAVSGPVTDYMRGKGFILAEKFEKHGIFLRDDRKASA